MTYKELHEAFMKNHSGTTVAENFILVSSGPVLIFFNCCFRYILNRTVFEKLKNNSILIFLLDFAVIIIPLVLNFTVFSENALTYLMLLGTLFIATVVCLVPYIEKDNIFTYDYLRSQDKKPFISNFRSIVNIITAICILAVDFNIFPRKLAKTENFGYGLMDTGVGFYVVTNGIVTRYKRISTEKWTFLCKTCLNVLPLLILGAARFFSLTAVDYQTHHSEYGVHCNFFITLAAVKLLSSILLIFFNRHLFFITLAIALIHQLLLYTGLQDWVMSSVPRTDFLTANREGVVSLPGYLALYFASLILGNALRNISSSKDRLKYIIYFSVVLLCSTCLITASESVFPNSRRLANVTYIIWLLSLSLYIVIVASVFELFLQLFYSVLKSDGFHIFTPTIFEAINYNGLTFFLISNLLTGLVNLCFQTLYIDNITSVIIITIYMFCTCAVINTLYCYKIKLKWW